MKKYISLDAVVAEIEELRKIQPTDEFQPKEQNKIDWLAGKEFAIIILQLFLDTLEVKEVPIWEKVSPDTGQTTLYKDGDKSYLERFGYWIDLKDLDKLPKKNLKAQKGE